MADALVNWGDADNAVRQIRNLATEVDQAEAESQVNARRVDGAVGDIQATRADVDRLLSELDTAVANGKNVLLGAEWQSISKSRLDGNIVDLEASVRRASADYETAYAAAMDAIMRLRDTIDEVTTLFATACRRNGPAFEQAATEADAHLARWHHEADSGIRV